MVSSPTAELNLPLTPSVPKEPSPVKTPSGTQPRVHDIKNIGSGGSQSTVSRLKAGGFEPKGDRGFYNVTHRKGKEIGYFNATHKHGDPMKKLIASLKKRRQMPKQSYNKRKRAGLSAEASSDV